MSNHKAAFYKQKAGGLTFKPLKHKNGMPLSDVEYFELLGRKCQELDRENRSAVPTDYGTFDLNTVHVAKQICEALDEGMSKSDLNQYLQRCINYGGN